MPHWPGCISDPCLVGFVYQAGELCLKEVAWSLASGNPGWQNIVHDNCSRWRRCMIGLRARGQLATRHKNQLSLQPATKLRRGWLGLCVPMHYNSVVVQSCCPAAGVWPCEAACRNRSHSLKVCGKGQVCGVLSLLYG